METACRQQLDNVPEIDRSLTDRREYSVPYRIVKIEPSLARFAQPLRVDVLQVQARNPGTILLHNLNRIPAAVRVVAGIQAQPKRWIRNCVEQARHLFRCLDM